MTHIARLPIEWSEWEERDTRVIRVILRDGRQVLCTCHYLEPDEGGWLTLRRLFVKKVCAGQEAFKEGEYFYISRCFANEYWVEWEEVSDRITPVEFEEIVNDEHPHVRRRQRAQADEGLRVPEGGSVRITATDSPDANR